MSLSSWVENNFGELKNPYFCSSDQFRKIKHELEKLSGWKGNVLERMKERRKVIENVHTKQ